MAHDFLGNELSIGDDVVFLNYNVSSASLERGKITKVSDHTAEISGKRRAEYKIVKVNPMKPTMDNTWIPCSERMPEPGKRVLATDGGFVGEMYIGKRGEWRRYNVTYIQDLMALDILWWKPLPEPPKKGGYENDA